MNKRLIDMLLWDVESWTTITNAAARHGFVQHMRNKQRISEEALKIEWNRYLAEDCVMKIRNEEGELVCRDE